MKILFVYSKYDSRQLALIERAKLEMQGCVDEVVVMEVEEARNKFHIMATPAIIPICDHLQGEELMKDGADGQLIVTAEMYKLSEEEDRVIHEAETFRLDNMIKTENTKAVDKYTLELIEGGLL